MILARLYAVKKDIMDRLQIYCWRRYLSSSMAFSSSIGFLPLNVISVVLEESFRVIDCLFHPLTSELETKHWDCLV